MMKRVDRLTFVTRGSRPGVQTNRQVLCTLGQLNVCENTGLTAKINRRVLLADLRSRWYGLPPYDQPTAPLRLKVRMLTAEVMETMLYGCVTWTPTMTHLTRLRTAHHRLLLRSTASDGRRNLATVTTYHTCFSTQTHSPILAARTLRQRCESGGYFSRGRRLVRVTRRYPNEWCLTNWRGEKVTWEGKNRAGWVVSNATYQCLTCPPKKNNGYWRRRKRASGSDVLRKLQSSI